jgi:hypothetical protein
MATGLRHLKYSTDEYSRAVRQRHRQALAEEEGFWKSAVSYVTCFSCLFRHPDNVLPCGHAMCEACIQQFGIQENNNPFVFSLPKCFLCQRGLVVRQRPWEIQLNPDNAGVRILCLDGGGVRGVIQAKILELLEKEIDLGISIHEFFDLIVGIKTGKYSITALAITDGNTGGIIALGIGRNFWSAEMCLRKFKRLAKKAFKWHAGADLPVIGRVVAYFRDSFYRTEDLETQLKEAFKRNSEGRKLFGEDFSGYFATASVHRRTLKIAVSATSSMTNEAFVLTNYNRRIKGDGKLSNSDVATHFDKI